MFTSPNSVRLHCVCCAVSRFARMQTQASTISTPPLEWKAFSIIEKGGLRTAKQSCWLSVSCSIVFTSQLICDVVQETSGNYGRQIREFLYSPTVSHVSLHDIIIKHVWEGPHSVSQLFENFKDYRANALKLGNWAPLGQDMTENRN